MRKKLMLVWAIFLWQSFFMKAGRFGWLEHLYTEWDGKAELWPWIYEHTHSELNTILNEPKSLNCNEDLMAIWAFLNNKGCLIDFMNSIFFDKKKHIPWLINLFQVSYKVTFHFYRHQQVLKRYEAIMNSLDEKNFITIIKDKNFESLINVIKAMLDEKIVWGD